MPVDVAEVDVLQEYLQGVLNRANHHAKGVDQIALALVGAVIWRKSGVLRVMAVDGDMKNVLWFETDKSKYALSYNHEAGTIELREKSVRGNVVASLSNKTPLAELRTLFASL